jgi:hypothetical protein
MIWQVLAQVVLTSDQPAGDPSTTLFAALEQKKENNYYKTFSTPMSVHVLT